MNQFLLILGSLVCASAALGLINRRRENKPSSPKEPKRSLFHVTATPESRARMELWRQDLATSVPPDLQILTPLEQWYEDPPYCRQMQTTRILVDFGSSVPEFRTNNIGQKVPCKYPSFNYKGYCIHGLWATSTAPVLRNVWDCYIDYFEELKERPNDYPLHSHTDCR